MDLSDRALQEFHQLIEWETASPLPDGRLLGNARKRGCVIPSPSSRIEAIINQWGDSFDTILELGPCEGYFTVQLARLCQHLLSLELRPKNIICTLIRLFLHDIHHVELRLQDVRDLDEGLGRFDLLFHSGVLYHLENPVEHLFRIRNLSDRMYLETHYLSEDDPRFQRADIHHNGKCYKAGQWQEMDLEDIWAGAQPLSRILYLDSLLEALQDIGFEDVKIIDQADLPFAPRARLLAERRAQPPCARREADGEVLQRELTRAQAEISRLRSLEAQLQSLQQQLELAKRPGVPRRAWRAMRRMLSYVKSLLW